MIKLRNSEKTNPRDISRRKPHCHPERSSWFAQRSSHAVEGSLHPRKYRNTSLTLPIRESSPLPYLNSHSGTTLVKPHNPPNSAQLTHPTQEIILPTVS